MANKGERISIDLQFVLTDAMDDFYAMKIATEALNAIKGAMINGLPVKAVMSGVSLNAERRLQRRYIARRRRATVAAFPGGEDDGPPN